MMTHGESAAQTRRGILLSNSAASAQQWRSGPPPPPRPPCVRHKTSKSPVGWVEANGRGKGELGGEEWLVGRTKAT